MGDKAEGRLGLSGGRSRKRKRKSARPLPLSAALSARSLPFSVILPWRPPPSPQTPPPPYWQSTTSLFLPLTCGLGPFSYPIHFLLSGSHILRNDRFSAYYCSSNQSIDHFESISPSTPLFSLTASLHHIKKCLQ